METPPLSPGSPHLAQGSVSASGWGRGEGGDAGGERVGAGLTGCWAPWRTAGWLGTPGAGTVGAWQTLGLAGGPAETVSAVAAAAWAGETEAERASSVEGPRRLSPCWRGGAGLRGRGAGETHDVSQEHSGEKLAQRGHPH